MWENTTRVFCPFLLCIAWVFLSFSLQEDMPYFRKRMVWEIIHQQLLWGMSRQSNTVDQLAVTNSCFIMFAVPYWTGSRHSHVSLLGYKVTVNFFPPFRRQCLSLKWADAPWVRVWKLAVTSPGEWWRRNGVNLCLWDGGLPPHCTRGHVYGQMGLSSLVVTVVGAKLSSPRTMCLAAGSSRRVFFCFWNTYDLLDS